LSQTPIRGGHVTGGHVTGGHVTFLLPERNRRKACVAVLGGSLVCKEGGAGKRISCGES
jgi:hypothetical protein